MGDTVIALKDGDVGEWMRVVKAGSIGRNLQPSQAPATVGDSMRDKVQSHLMKANKA